MDQQVLPQREDIYRRTMEAYQSLPEQPTDIKLMGGYMHGDYCWFPADNAAHEEPQYSIKW